MLAGATYLYQTAFSMAGAPIARHGCAAASSSASVLAFVVSTVSENGNEAIAVAPAILSLDGPAAASAGVAPSTSPLIASSTARSFIRITTHPPALRRPLRAGVPRENHAVPRECQSQPTARIATLRPWAPQLGTGSEVARRDDSDPAMFNEDEQIVIAGHDGRCLACDRGG